MAEVNLHPRCQWAGCQRRADDVRLVDEKWWLCPAHTAEHRQEHPTDYFAAKERQGRSATTTVEEVLRRAKRGSFLARAAGERARRAIVQARREVQADQIRELAREQVPLVEQQLRQAMEHLGVLRSLAGYGGQRAKRVPGVRPDRGRGRDVVYREKTDAG